MDLQNENKTSIFNVIYTTHQHTHPHLPVDLNKNCRYPREEWRPIPVGSQPAIEQVWVHPVQV